MRIQGAGGESYSAAGLSYSCINKNIILRERHTQVCLQPEPGALCTGLQPRQLANAPMKPSKSITPSYSLLYTRNSI